MAGPNAGILPAKQGPYKANCAFNLAAFTIGAETGGTTRNVAVQLQDSRGKNIAQRAFCQVYLSDAADGSAITATATSSALAVGTNGAIIQTEVSGKMLNMLSDATGRFDLNVIQSSTPKTYYMVVVMPDGSISVSAAITIT